MPVHIPILAYVESSLRPSWNERIAPFSQRALLAERPPYLTCVRLGDRSVFRIRLSITLLFWFTWACASI